MTQSKYTKRIAAAAGSLAGLTAAPLVSEAGLVHVTGSPVSLSTSAANGTSVTWDIDGDTVSDFRLRASVNSGASYGNPFRNAVVFLASNTASFGRGNGRGIVAPFHTDNVLELPLSFSVGPTNIFGRNNSGSAADGYYAYRNAMYSFNGAIAIGYDLNYGIHEGDNAIGFRFDDGSGLRYGFAIFNLDSTTGTVTISEWTYDSDVDTPVHVTVDLTNPVPEPGSLALLAMGAAGLLMYRARRTSRKPAKTTPAV